jgi:hypothetical protein
LIAQAAKILPALKKSDKRLKPSASQQDIVIKNLASDVYKWGKRLQRTRSKRLIQTAPVVLRRVMRIIEKKPDIILKKKGRIGALLNRSTQKIAKGSAAR